MFFQFRHNIKTRGISINRKFNSNNTTRHRFFAERVVGARNSLPANVSLSNLSTFKQSIADVDFSELLK